jgi:hypothetical protein
MSRQRDAAALHAYQLATVAMLPELERLAVPWRLLSWYKLQREIRRRNDYVRRELDRLSR